MTCDRRAQPEPARIAFLSRFLCSDSPGLVSGVLTLGELAQTFRAMDKETQAYLFRLGNPYAKLSIVDQDEAPEVRSATAEPARRKRFRSSLANVDQPTQAYLFKLEDPYAKLSFATEIIPQGSTEFLWKSKTEVYHYVAESFALPQLLTRPPALLKRFGEKVTRLSPLAQKALYDRLSAHIPDVNVVHNRLSPKELDRLLTTLVEMANDAAALDVQAG